MKIRTLNPATEEILAEYEFILISNPQVPFDGIKNPVGKEISRYDLKEFLNIKSGIMS
jgi:hypothetical protein